MGDTNKLKNFMNIFRVDFKLNDRLRKLFFFYLLWLQKESVPFCISKYVNFSFI